MEQKIEAICNLLIRKGLITREELQLEIQRVREAEWKARRESVSRAHE